MKEKLSPEKEGLITSIPPPRYLLGEDAGITTSKKRPWIDRLGLLIVIPLFAALAMLAFRTNVVSIDIILPFGRGLSTFGPGQCSGHGIKISRTCICDLGYTGSQCSEVAPIDEPSQPTPVSDDKTIALFFDHFGLDSPTGEANTLLAKELAKSGFKITVVSVGSKKVEDDIEGITLHHIESSSFDYGSSDIVSNSMSVYSYLQQNYYDVVYFDSSNAYGYYTLLAKKQGLRCYSSRFIVGVNSFGESVISQINSGTDEPVTDVELLKKDFMRERTIQLADSVVFSGESLISILEDPSQVSSKAHIIPALPLGIAPAEQSKDTEFPEELVFVGDFDIASGLVLFCDALDNLNGIVSGKQITVTFYGKPSYVGSVPSKEYIKNRATEWSKFTVNIMENSLLVQQTIEYLGDKSTSRLVIFPSSFTPNPVITQNIALAGIPFIAARTPENEGLVSKSSSEEVLFELEDSYELSLKLLETLKLGIARVTPNIINSSKLWNELFAEAAAAKGSCDNSETGKPFVSVVLTHTKGASIESLKNAISSLESQTYKEYEVILVTDGETSDADVYLRNLAWQWWEEKGWKVLREPRRNAVEAKNIGARHAVGKYIFFMDETSYAKSHELETLVRVAEMNTADAVTAGHDTIGRGQKVRRSVPVGNAKLVGLFENVYGSVILVKRDSFQNVGGLTGFSSEHSIYELLSKLSIKGHTIETVAEPLQWHEKETGVIPEHVKDNILKQYLRHNDVAAPSQRKLVQHLSRKRGLDMEEFESNYPTFSSTMTKDFQFTFNPTFEMTFHETFPVTSFEMTFHETFYATSFDMTFSETLHATATFPEETMTTSISLSQPTGLSTVVDTTLGTTTLQPTLPPTSITTFTKPSFTLSFTSALPSYTPPVVPSFSVVLIAPTEIPNCDSQPFTIDLTNSVGANITYNFTTTSTNSSIITAFNDISGQRKGIYKLNSSIFNVGELVTYNVTAINNKNNETRTVTRTVLKVSTQLFSVSIVSGSFITSVRGQPVALDARAKMPTCFSGATNFTFSWSVIDSNNTSALPNDIITNATSLYIPPFTLKYGSYNVTVTASANSISASFNANLLISTTPIFVAIKEGRYMDVGAQDDVTLTANAYDFDEENGGDFDFVWASQNGCFSGVLYGQTPTINSKETPSLTVGQSCNIVLLAIDKNVGRNDTAGITLNVVAGTPPRIIVYRDPEANIVSTAEDVFFYADAVVNNEYLDPEDVEWAFSVPLTSPTQLSADKYTTDMNTLEIPPGSLQDGADYLFRISATYNGATGNTEVGITTGNPPSGGVVTVTNPNSSELQNGDVASGYHILSSFQIITNGWTGQQPFYYSFGYVTKGEESDDIPYTFLSTQSFMDNIHLPDTVDYVYAEATDMYGLTTRAKKTVTVVKKTMTDSEKSNLTDQLLANLKSSTNPSDALISLDALLNFADLDDESLSPETRAKMMEAQAMALALLDTLLGGLGDNVDPGLASKSLSIVSNSDIKSADDTTVDKTLDTFSSLVTKSGSGSKGMDKDVAKQAGKFIDNVLSRPNTKLKKRQSSSPNLGSKLKNVVNDLGKGLVASEKCQASGNPQQVDGTSFIVQSKRVVAASGRPGDSKRTIGGFNFVFPPLPAGCYDSVVSLFNATTDQASKKIVTRVLNVAVYQSGQNTTKSFTGQFQYNATTSSGAFQSSNTRQCVGSNDGSTWSSIGCTTTPVNSTTVSCSCSASYSQFAAQAVTQITTTSTSPTGPTDWPTNPPTDPITPTGSTGAIVGGIIGGVVVIGGGLGFMRYRQRRRS